MQAHATQDKILWPRFKMIIWINGAFGAGKTQTAAELNRRLKNSYIYDPEYLGFFLRKNIPSSIKKGDFQDYQVWRELIAVS